MYKTMIPRHTPELLDTTLREGEQCYGVFFPIETKKKIAFLLDEIGLDFIEVGHPAAAPSIAKAVSEIAALNLRSRLIAHARLDVHEIRLVKDLGLQWVGLFCGVNDRSRTRYGLSKQALFKKVGGAVSYAKARGLSVKFGCEDASRTETGELAEFYSFLLSLGVERLSYADTLGTLRPADLERLHARLNGQIPFSRLHFHFHDDSGFAYENAVTATEYGARCIDVSVSGIGERVGLVSLEPMLAFLSRERVREYKTSSLREVVSLVGSCIHQARYENRRFAHKSGIHIDGVIKDPSNYELTDPGRAGSGRILVLSKLIGRSGLRMLLSRQGFADDDRTLQPLLRQIKADDALELTNPEEISRYFAAQGLKKRPA